MESMDTHTLHWILLTSTAITSFIFGGILGAWYTTRTLEKRMRVFVNDLTKNGLDKK